MFLIVSKWKGLKITISNNKKIIITNKLKGLKDVEAKRVKRGLRLESKQDHRVYPPMLCF